jgi:uncharacterized protein (TIGR03083 family)
LSSRDYREAVRAAGRLLLLEADALPIVLGRAGPDDHDLPTACPGWSVRDVLAHCGAALGGFVRGTAGSFTPEDNQREVDERASWPIEQVLDELFESYAAAADLIDELGGCRRRVGARRVGPWRRRT